MSHEKDIFIPRRSGTYTYCSSASSSTTTPTIANGTLYAGPFILPKARTLTRIGLAVTTGSSSGGIIRLGIWGDDGDGFPSSLLLDSGVSGSASTVLNNGFIDATSVSVQEITISVALAGGLYWVGAVVQGAPVTAPFLSCVNNTTGTVGGTSLPTVGNSPVAYTQASVTGALPGSFAGAVTPTGTMPRIFVKT